MSSRLATVFAGDDGLRHVLLCGPAAGDRVYVDLATGALSMPEALAQEAVKRRFDYVITVDADGRLSFPDTQAEARFRDLTREPSRDPQASASRPASLHSEREPHNGTAPRPAGSDDRVPAGTDALLAAIGRIERAQRGKQRFFVQFVDLGRMLTPGEPQSPRAGQVFDAVGRILTVDRGHPGSRLVVRVPDNVLEVARRLLTAHDHGATHWLEVRVPLPDVDEIGAFLSRAADGHGLYGNAQAAASQLVRRRYSLARISEALRSGIEAGKRDLTDMLSNEPDQAGMDAALARLDALVGLTELKKALRALMREAIARQRAASTDAAADPPALHMALLGRPGTGKTEVASLLAALLHAAGACRRNVLVKATIADVVGPYNSGEAISNLRSLVERAAGGVLFLDEAYALAENEWGRQAIQVLLSEMEDRRSDLVVVLAGYADRMQTFFQANEGLRSRIAYTFQLPDYTPDELCEIFDRRARASTVEITPAARQAAHAILRREAMRPHDNARDVRNHFERWNGQRLSEGSARLEPRHVTDPRTPSWREAEALIRNHAARFRDLPEVTRWMESTLNMSRDAFARGRLPKTPRLAFVGPPGTGKTESARVIGEFLRHCGVLRGGRVLERSLKDFTSSRGGGAIERTAQQFRDAKECVLFIDEIYAFAADANGREILDQIVPLLTTPEHADVAVIFAGYEDRMSEVYRTNPGLRDRIDTTVRFAWPDAEALADIALDHLRTQHGRTPAADERPQFQERLAQVLRARRSQPDFAGARSAMALANDVFRTASGRSGGTVTLDDLPKPAVPPGFAELKQAFLAAFPRSPSLVDPLLRIAARIRHHQSGTAPMAIGVQLIGPPGTGKSTFARWILEHLSRRAGAADAPMVERSAQSLQGVYLGEAQDNVRRAFESAGGGLLFLDEFHALAADSTRPGLYSVQIAKEVVAQMTNPKNARTIVIVAGYQREMEVAIGLDPGLLSRFPDRIVLPAPTDSELARIAFDAMANSFGGLGALTFATVLPQLERHFAARRRHDGEAFGNFRIADELARNVHTRAMIRCDGERIAFELGDLLEELDG
jgi:SpoVK/Ycf46/Vps4 family AAA+-type ATPase